MPSVNTWGYLVTVLVSIHDIINLAFCLLLVNCINKFISYSSTAEGAFANRRDKKVQQELVREAGLRAVRQACGAKFSEVEAFLRSEEFPVVLKPTDSAGSDGVKLCNTFEEAKEHFEYLLTVEAVNGGYNTQVLCQEFLRGKEVRGVGIMYWLALKQQRQH